MNSDLPMLSNVRESSEFSVESPTSYIPSPPKRKSGRKPTFSAEARRQRNRDAQAAFRERRTEYIKELEETVKIYGEKLRSIEALRASTADDCLMLRYKNSLLERILLHKGIDVQAELNSKLWRPTTSPVGKSIHSTITGAHGTIKRLSKTKVAGPALSTQQPVPSPHYTSSVSNSPPTNEPITPPPLAPPAPKRAKTRHNHQKSHLPTTSYRREDHRKIFPPAAPHPSNESNSTTQEFRTHKPHIEALASPEDPSLTGFLEAEDNPYSLGSLDEFDFSTDYSAMTPTSFPAL